MSKTQNTTEKVTVGRLTITSPAGRSGPAYCSCIVPGACDSGRG
ncbi:hypothetical protein [Mycobacterium sp. IS-1590]|nr:hypothetical protein [Mycobacterium sp. IS-1590]